MDSLGTKFLFCVLIVSGTVVELNGALVRQKRFVSLFTDSANIISGGLQQSSDILNQGIQNQKAIISQVPSLIQKTSQAIQNTVLGAAEFPATVAANVVIQGANAFISTTKKETVSLPEINTSVLGFGKFVANGGKIKTLSTLESDGRVKLQRSGLSLLIDIPVRLGNLSVEYENYSFSTWGINIKGNVKATIGKNAFLIKLRLQPTPVCIVNMDRVEVVALEDIKVELQGSFASFLKSAANYIATYLQDTIKTEVQKSLDEQLKKFVKENCKLICANFAPLSTS